MISIHAPHEGERPSTAFILDAIKIFQSTLPTRGSDTVAEDYDGALEISIHAPHEGERRSTYTCFVFGIFYFNPRSPRGGATSMPLKIILEPLGFQSTLPTRGSDNIIIL